MMRPDGKPMRALRFLAERQTPAYEGDVWAALSWRPKGENVYWGDTLRDLWQRGLAERRGGPGGYSYTITDVGRSLVESQERL